MDGNQRMIRKHIVFTGQVQGVGFRWQARQAAQLYDCTGWCRNEWDGSVTMEIQGSGDAIDRVVRSIQDGRYVWIRDMDVTEIPVDPEESGFGTE